MALALAVAVVAGWSIMRLSGRSDRASEASQSVAGLAAGVARPATLLVATAQRRRGESPEAARAPTPGVPEQMAPFLGQMFASLASLGRSTGEYGLERAVARAVRTTAETQDAVYAGGAAAVPAATRAPAVVDSLNVAFAALDVRLASRARTASRLAEGGTMLIMLVAALSLIVLLRRYDGMRARLTDRLHRQATHDPLTGLANRRQLASDLEAAGRSATDLRPARLVVYDLDGFKAYNDTFGHHGGDLLLTRLALALAAASAPYGTSYRLGGDEFCTLFAGGADDRVVRGCVEALSEVGDAFSIACSHGSVLLPTEAADTELAMQLADARMYGEKDSGRASAGQQTRNLAIKLLSVQEPDVEAHSEHVAALAAGVGRRLGLSAAECSELVRAAELHDIGKVAIPLAVLHKPGPLDEQEWEMMRRHTTIGANILMSAPALRSVAEIVRNTHERYDGKGYPNGIAGEAIPLASRIVSVCDSYDAMISERQYSPRLSEEGALDQLRRHAGDQFDPVVVAAFLAEHRAQSTAATVSAQVARAASALTGPDAQ